MAKHELDQLVVTNPTDEYFEVKWGGQPYGIHPGQQIIWMRFLAEHYAKHLTDSILLKMERKHKLDYLAAGHSESDYRPVSYLNSRSKRPKVIDTILKGVYQYHKQQVADPNAMLQQQIDQANQQGQPADKELNLGDAVDPLYRNLKADDDEKQIPAQPAPEAPQPAPMPGPVPQPPAQPEVPQTAPIEPQKPAEDVALEADSDDDSGRSMTELRKEADKLGITVPFGITKDGLKDLIRKQYA